ncbi:OadG family transporter subunit [Oceanivirga salmonicida]|uniref:OadG family transporter subunit n=1 Tax=Oceanivirga salmonicida TaxID=1769291 RepID=UPI00082DDE3B|nr:OadG family transporter subunit [Oceanivirga salmonicida]
MKSIIYGSNHVGIIDSIYVTIVSIILVFSILILISLILYLFKYIPKEKVENKVIKNVKKDFESDKKFSIEDIKSEIELVALLVAVIEQSNDMDNSNIKIRSIREIN